MLLSLDMRPFLHRLSCCSPEPSTQNMGRMLRVAICLLLAVAALLSCIPPSRAADMDREPKEGPHALSGHVCEAAAGRRRSPMLQEHGLAHNGHGSQQRLQAWDSATGPTAVCVVRLCCEVQASVWFQSPLISNPFQM